MFNVSGLRSLTLTHRGLEQRGLFQAAVFARIGTATCFRVCELLQIAERDS